MSSDPQNNNNNNNNLQLVPESILKRKHDLDELKSKRASAELHKPRGNRKVFSAKNRAIVKIRKPERFVANARMRKHHMQRYNRVLKKGMQKRASNKEVVLTKKVLPEDDDAVTEESDKVETMKYKSNSVGSSFVFAIRIRDGIGSPYKVQKALRTLRLNNLNEGIFLKYTDSARKLLHLVEPYVLYGVPSKATVTDLIVRRGHGRVNGKRTPLSDNIIVEDELGEETGIICLEDLVHEIHSTGENFIKAASFLAPFQFTALKSKFQKDTLNEKDTNDYGDKGELIDEYIRQML